MTLQDSDNLIDPARVKAFASKLALTDPVSVGLIASEFGTSTRTLQRQLALQGFSLRAMIVESRLEIARVLLCMTDLDVQEIAVRVGYSTPSSFSRAFACWAGCSPQSFRKAAKRRGSQMRGGGAKWADSLPGAI